MKRENKNQYLVNYQIKGNKILLLDENGEKLGVFSKEDALKKGEIEGKDVIQIGYNGKEDIVIAKLMEYGKFMYQLKKQQKEKKKSQKIKGLKEIKFSYNIGKNDFELKIKKAKEFLQEGYNVRFIGELRGRENWYKESMIERLKKIENELRDYGKSQGIKEERKGYSLLLFAKVK